MVTSNMTTTAALLKMFFSFVDQTVCQTNQRFAGNIKSSMYMVKIKDNAVHVVHCLFSVHLIYLVCK